MDIRLNLSDNNGWTKPTFEWQKGGEIIFSWTNNPHRVLDQVSAITSFHDIQHSFLKIQVHRQRGHCSTWSSYHLHILLLIKGFSLREAYKKKNIYTRVEANKNLQREVTPITPTENVRHHYLFSMGGSPAVNTKFLPAHPFTENHLESQIPSNLNVEDNGQPPLLIWRAVFTTDDL